MPNRLTEALEAAVEGGPHAAADLLATVYNELRAMARARLARIGPGQTVEATDLVHEAWMRIVSDEDPGWNSRAHFFGAAARAMRNILVEQARKKSSLKRDSKRKQELSDDEPLIVTRQPITDMLSLNEALEGLEAAHPRQTRVVELRFFSGLSMPDVAEVMGISLATVERDWRFAKAALGRAIRGDDEEL